MLVTLSQKGFWLSVLGVIATLLTAFGLDLGLSTQTQADIAVGLSALVSVINIGIHTLQRRAEKSGDKPKGGGSVNASMVLLPVVFALCLFAAACSTLPTPKTPAQSLAYTEGGYTAVVQEAVSLHNAHALSTSQEARLDVLIQRGNAALDAAHTALAQGDAGTVQGRLAVVDDVLVALRSMVQQEMTPPETQHGQ